MAKTYFLVLLLSGVGSRDLPTPASLLGPRNYNHHAYELEKPEPTKQGPVLFPNDGPPPPRTPLIVTSRPLIESVARSELNNTIAEQSVLNRVSFKPQFLARVKDYRAYGIEKEKEYDYEEQPVLPPIYKAISNHAKQKLRATLQRKVPVPVYSNYKVNDETNHYRNDINNDDNSDHSQAQNYAFSYTVRDKETGDDFSHSQHSSGSATNGEYRVRLPDGRMQIVSYTADENGYKADVRYDDEDKTQGNSIDYNVNRNYDHNNDYVHRQNFEIRQQDLSKVNHNHAINNVAHINRDNFHNNYKTNYNYNNQDVYNTQSINDLTDNNYLKQTETKPVTENSNYKEDYNQYADLSKEYYGTDYSLEYDDKYNNYDPHKSKFTAFSGPKNPKPIVQKTYKSGSTVRPSYDELKPLFVQKKPFKTHTANDYLFSNIPIEIKVPSTTPSPYSFAAPSTEHVVIIGTTKPHLYTNIRNSIPPIHVIPAPIKYSTPNYIVSSTPAPRSFLASTISSIANLKKNIDFSGAKPVLTSTFIDKINKYISYK